MKITAIKAQVKNAGRVSVYVDEKYAFSLSHAQLLDQKLRIGLEFDAARLAELKYTSDFGKAYERALHYAMIRPRSYREMEGYCRRKKWPAGDCQAVIQKLVEKRYLDDHYFARAWVESRQATKAMSTRKLRLELKQKGVADDIIADVLEKTAYSDQRALQELIAKKYRLSRYKNDPQKLMQYLARQGFGYDDIKTALDNLGAGKG